MRRLYTFVLATLLSNAFAIPSSQSRSSPSKPLGTLILADTGVGHRSSPVTEWRTSIRSLSTDGTSAKRLIEFGLPTPANEPIGANSLTRDPKTGNLYMATWGAIIRTDKDGLSNVTVVEENDGVTVVEILGEKLYYGVMREGLIKRADLDGSNVEVLLNVSMGLDYSFGDSYTPANSYPSGIAVDKDNGCIYWSSSMTSSENVGQGTIRRISLDQLGSTSRSSDGEVLASQIEMPGQLRVVGHFLYFVQTGRWLDSPTSISRIRIPASSSSNTLTDSSPDTQSTQVLVHSNMSSIFFGTDFDNTNLTLSIQSFAVDQDKEKMWFAIQSSVRVMLAKIVEMGIDGIDESGLKVVNQNVSDIGVPVGVEYIR